MHYRGPTGKANSGATLLEVLVALGILIIGIIGTVQLFPISLEQLQRSNESTVVSRMAASRLDEVQTTSGEGLTLRRLQDSPRFRYVPGETAPDPDENGNGNGAGELQLPQDRQLFESYTTSVQRVPGAPHLHRVTMNVRMHDGRYKQYVTYVTRK
ncbi:MAG: hypothetical protein R6W89_07150 [Candidatus Hydrogenedentota bacterium]